MKHQVSGEAPKHCSHSKSLFSFRERTDEEARSVHSISCRRSLTNPQDPPSFKFGRIGADPRRVFADYEDGAGRPHGLPLSCGCVLLLFLLLCPYLPSLRFVLFDLALVSLLIFGAGPTTILRRSESKYDSMAAPYPVPQWNIASPPGGSRRCS